MKETISINFADFVSRFEPRNNYFYNLLSRYYNVEIADNPELLFCTCYGHQRYKYNSLKVYYTGENERPNLEENDFAMSFDYLDDVRHYRLPLYALYIEQAERERQAGRVFNPYSARESIIETLCRERTEEEAVQIWRSKKGFCCFLNSNPHAELRINVFKKLSRYKRVDSGGAVLNNIGRRVNDKLEFIKDYRFVFAMENSSYPGYTTEKLVEPFFVDSIPLYWGNPLVGNDFNKAAFINFHDSGNEDEFVERIIAIDQDEHAGIEMLMQPKFTKGQVNEFIKEENVLDFLANIIEKRKTIVPVSSTLKGRVHNTRRIFQFKKSEFASKVRNLIK